MHRRLVHAGPDSHFGPRRRFRFIVPRVVVSAATRLQRWRRNILSAWSPVDAFRGLVLTGLLTGCVCFWWRLGQFFIGMLAL